MLALMISGAAAAVLCVYFLGVVLHKKHVVYVMPKSAFLFYFLSFTWGLPMTLFGCAAAVILLPFYKKPKKFGRAFALPIGNIHSGMSLGIFFVCPSGREDSPLMRHEYGHCIQNIYLGVFMPFAVALPSVIRFWTRNLQSKRGSAPKRRYDDIWFEGSATKSGEECFKGLSASKRGASTD